MKEGIGRKKEIGTNPQFTSLQNDTRGTGIILYISYDQSPSQLLIH